MPDKRIKILLIGPWHSDVHWIAVTYASIYGEQWQVQYPNQREN